MGNFRNILVLFESGGWMIVPLIICSVISLSIIIEHVWLWQKSFREFKNILKKITDINKKEFKNTDPVSTFFNWYQKNTYSEQEEKKKLTEYLFQIYEHRINWLNTIAAIAPLLGLLGTVFGMIRIFTIVSVQKPSNPIAALSGGISEALIATAGGLIVAIISAVGYHYLMNSLEAIISRLDEWISSNANEAKLANSEP